MSSIQRGKSGCLIALSLDQAEVAEQVTGLELLQRFESIGGVLASRRENGHSSMEVDGPAEKSDEDKAWSSSDIGQILEIGIRDQRGI